MFRLDFMGFEIWASDSGNQLFSTTNWNVALAWALDYWLREGDAALGALSVGDEQDRWVVSGNGLRDLLRQQMWQAPAPWVTSANSLLDNRTRRLVVALAP
jgi:hypothetical protein